MNFIESGVVTILLVEKIIFQKIRTHFSDSPPFSHHMTVATVEN